MVDTYSPLEETIIIFSCGRSILSKYLLKSYQILNLLLILLINLKRSLEAQSILGGADLKPFYGLIDGGREGEFFKEMKELFYYSQLRQ